jgi:hypothetical protein
MVKMPATCQDCGPSLAPGRSTMCASCSARLTQRLRWMRQRVIKARAKAQAQAGLAGVPDKAG